MRQASGLLCIEGQKLVDACDVCPAISISEVIRDFVCSDVNHNCYRSGAAVDRVLTITSTDKDGLLSESKETTACRV